MIKKTIRALAMGVIALASLPTVALAEEESGGGITLLIPAIAELIPACIAFLIVFIIMSKLVWPTVVKMMEDRESKLQGDLDAAEKAKEEAQANAKASAESIAAAQREAADIIAAAKLAAENERAQILAAAQKDAAATIARVHDVRENLDAARMMEALK